MILGRIEAPHFVAGFEAEHGVVTRTAPIISYMLGWPLRRVLIYVKGRRWRIERVRP